MFQYDLFPDCFVLANDIMNIHIHELQQTIVMIKAQNNHHKTKQLIYHGITGMCVSMGEGVRMWGEHMWGGGAGAHVGGEGGGDSANGVGGTQVGYRHFELSDMRNLTHNKYLGLSFL